MTGMDEQKTLLQQIREKESELSRRQESAVKKTEDIMSLAKADAERIAADADARGKAMAEVYRDQRKERIALEADEIKGRGSAEALALRKSGEEHLSDAVGLIVDAVTYAAQDEKDPGNRP